MMVISYKVHVYWLHIDLQMCSKFQQNILIAGRTPLYVCLMTNVLTDYWHTSVSTLTSLFPCSKATGVTVRLLACDEILDVAVLLSGVSLSFSLSLDTELLGG